MKINKRIIVVLMAGVISTTGLVQAKDTPTKLIDARADRTQYAPYLKEI